MGNSLKLGCRPLSLRDVIVPEKVSKSSSPSLAEVDKLKLQAFNIEDEYQLDDLLGGIEQALSSFRERKEKEGMFPKNVQNNISDAATMLSIVGNNFQSTNSQVDAARLCTESAKVVRDLLAGAKNLHWAGAALSLVAYVLTRIDQVSSNNTECISLLVAMRDLAKHIRSLIPQLPENNLKLQEATVIIAKGTALCCAHLETGPLSKLGFAGSTKDDMDQLRKVIDRLYPNLILSAVEVVLDRTAVLTRQSSIPLSPLTPEYPTNKVGLDERVDTVIEKLKMQDPSIRAIVLHGMGGIGKSTLGDGVYARVNPTGRTHCKIEVGENPSREKLRDLQANIMERLSGVKRRIGDYNEGCQKLDYFLRTECHEPLFIFIDNVLDIEALHDLLPERLVLPKRSRLLVTSRGVNVCAMFKEKGIESEQYEVEELDFAQAKKLLCMHVFERPEPPVEKQQQVTDVLKACGGLPLALEVVGKYLRFHKRDSAWGHVISSLQSWDSLSGTKENRLYHKLEFSYDQLTNSQRKAFLDITNFFLDLPWEMVNYVIGEDRLVALQELALVKKKRLDFDEVSRVHIHDLFVALGRNYEKGVRIWSNGASELPSVLNDNDPEMKKIEGLCLRNCLEALPAKILDILCHSLRVLILEHEVVGQCQNVPIQLQLFITKGSMPFQHLEKLTRLAVLRMCEVDMDFENIEFPLNLKDLSMSECSTLKQLPRLFGQLHSLHTLDLSLCENLKNIPKGFGQLSSLQSLELRFCKMLEELPEDFGHLKALESLDLGGCENLTALPTTFGLLSTLQRLELWNCERLQELPKDFGQLALLRELNLYGCKSLLELPKSFGNLSGLQTLSLGGCSGLSRLSENFGRLSSLRALRLTDDCLSLTALPQSFNQLSALELLDVAGCTVQIMESVSELVSANCTILCEEASGDYLEKMDRSPSYSFPSDADFLEDYYSSMMET